MKLLNDLHKLGILRVGVAGGTYKSSKDMPDELMFDNVYDKEKDLAGGGEVKKEEDGGSGGGRKGPDKSSGLLFSVLLVVTLFLGYIYFTFLVFFPMLLVSLFLVFKLFGYWRGSGSMKMIWIYFFVYVILVMIVSFIGRPMYAKPVENFNVSGTQNTDVSDKTDTDYQVQVIDEAEWIDYAGVKSPIFTFRYPKSYEIQEVGTSTMVYVDRNKDPDYHIVYSVLEGGSAFQRLSAVCHYRCCGI